jgi:hypothetical protein
MAATLTPGNLALGPGTLWVANFGTAEPADADVEDDPGAGWSSAGLTIGGISIEIASEFKALEADQIPITPESRKTNEDVTLTTRLAEVTLSNLYVALTDGTVTTGVGYDSFDPSTTDSSNSPVYRAFLFDGYGAGGYRRRVIIRKGLNTAAVKVDSNKTDQQAYDLKVKAHYVSSSIKPWRVVQAKAGS